MLFPYDFSEDIENRAERLEDSDRGWMMLFLVSRPKLTESMNREVSNERRILFVTCYK